MLFSFFYYVLNTIFLLVNSFLISVLLFFLYVYLMGAQGDLGVGWAFGPIMLFVGPVVMLIYAGILFSFREKTDTFKRNILVIASIPTVGLFLYQFFVRGGILDHLLVN